MVAEAFETPSENSGVYSENAEELQKMSEETKYLGLDEKCWILAAMLGQDWSWQEGEAHCASV